MAGLGNGSWLKAKLQVARIGLLMPFKTMKGVPNGSIDRALDLHAAVFQSQPACLLVVVGSYLFCSIPIVYLLVM